MILMLDIYEWYSYSVYIEVRVKWRDLLIVWGYLILWIYINVWCNYWKLIIVIDYNLIIYLGDIVEVMFIFF